MYSVYQHWDPLKTCVVGRAYPPEFFQFIRDPNTRTRFEQLAIETEEDFQTLIQLLECNGIQVLRPTLPDNLNSLFVDGKWIQPPVAPRDYFLMIENKLWVPTVPNNSHAWTVFYRDYKLAEWPDFIRESDFFKSMPLNTHNNLITQFTKFKLTDHLHHTTKLSAYKQIFDHVQAQGNQIVNTELDFINGCFVSRIGHDLYFATQNYYDDQQLLLNQVNERFPNTRNRVVNAGGHGDATYCPIAPGLIVSLKDIPTYADTFPGWEIIYLPPSDYAHMTEFQHSMKINRGRWFLPGFEQDTNLINLVEHYFDHWVGNVAETVFYVNILIINPKNIVVSSYNEQVFQACERRGITMHVVNFRHRYFWDCGIHCITNDLHRKGHSQSFL